MSGIYLGYGTTPGTLGWATQVIDYLSTGYVKVNMSVVSLTDNPGFTAACTYYILAEAGI